MYTQLYFNNRLNYIFQNEYFILLINKNTYFIYLFLFQLYNNIFTFIN